ncbi:carbon-nitrogen hydrolase family protein [Streptomyces genisteinicus]|uniref:Carbon-nitrogen hydrolase family protein n=1 Tax=Streptomyces genisteinicus TaxID=2768068 RepID=A0A7H0HRJ8_9ACTN|nr:carbon-nitrogen hydrolase family protein [Streptomyces genisteinicus]QNP63164.1 carbon-nitrogen hydrolase family protein [Streptomyces genisteinicus]
MRIAAAQFPSVLGGIEENVRSMTALVERAGEQGVRFVAFCELSANGYLLDPIAAGPDAWLTEDDARLEPLREACRRTSTAALIGCAAVTGGERPAIGALVIGPDGEPLARYAKTHLCGPEQDVFAAGTADGRFVLDGVRFAVAVCYDNRFPEVAERAAADGCEVYVASSALDAANDSFETVMPVRARDNGLHVLLANHVGGGDAGDCLGDSGVWGPDGALLASAGRTAPGLVVWDLPTR